MTSIPDQQTPIVFSHTYQLFSQLFWEGPGPWIQPYLEDLPDLNQHLPQIWSPAAIDDQQALHFNIFGMNIFPNEAIFLDPEMIIGGQITNGLNIFYNQIRYAPQNIGELNNSNPANNPDHLSVLFGAMAFLCQKMGSVSTDQEIHYIYTQQSNLFTNHLLRWLPAFLFATSQLNAPFYTSLTELILDFVALHLETLPNLETKPSFELPSPPNILDDEKTSLKDIASYLLTPAYSGFYISRTTITELSRPQKLPHGFGDRLQMLTNLLRTAAEYDEVSILINHIQAFLAQWDVFYSNTIESYPLLSPYIHPWKHHLAKTSNLLLKLKDSAQHIHHA